MKKYLWMSSAALVICALRVKSRDFAHLDILTLILSQTLTMAFQSSSYIFQCLSVVCSYLRRGKRPNIILFLNHDYRKNSKIWDTKFSLAIIVLKLVKFDVTLH